MPGTRDSQNHILIECPAPGSCPVPLHNGDQVPCVCCEQRPAGHGHFALYCEPCADQPLWGCSH